MKLTAETGLCQHRHAKADTVAASVSEVRGTRQGRRMTKILADKVKKGVGGVEREPPGELTTDRMEYQSAPSER